MLSVENVFLSSPFQYKQFNNSNKKTVKNLNTASHYTDNVNSTNNINIKQKIINSKSFFHIENLNQQYNNNNNNNNNNDEQDKIDLAHAIFRHKYGDHFTLLNVFDAFEMSGFSNTWCTKYFINFRSLKTAVKIRFFILFF
jgi:hypothetical protein